MSENRKRKKPPLTFMFNPSEYLWDVNTCMMTLAEEGAQWREIMQATDDRDYEKLESYPFIGRVFSGKVFRPQIPKNVRARVLGVGACVICGSKEKLEVDHIHPYSKNGAHDESNFQCLCQKCNRKKHAKIPTP